MKTLQSVALPMVVVALVAACGGSGVDDGSSFDLTGTPGSLLATPTALGSLTPEWYAQTAQTNATLASLLQVAGAPQCTVTFNYFQYGTLGGAGEKTTASGGIMVPSGNDPACTGPRPVLLYAHGTAIDKNKNMADPSDGEAAVVAATYAAHGYIVVAPNYAGYEASTLPYHPYVNLEQQAKDVTDALAAARKGFAAVGANAGSQLFVAGYSQGGFVSMAAQRALQLAGTPVTAGAHSSGPYALGNYVDANFLGRVALGATAFTPLLSTSFQRAYGNIYPNPAAMYETAFASGIEGLLPSTTPTDALFATGKLPPTFMFDGPAPDPRLALFFGTPHLVRASFRQALLADYASRPTAPQHPLRVAAYKNDLLQQNWTPDRSMLLCGGNADPTVFFDVNTGRAQAYFGSRMPAGSLLVLDVDSAPTSPGDPFAGIKAGFQLAKGAAGDPAEVLRAYHGSLVPPFCNRASREYFNQFLALPG